MVRGCFVFNVHAPVAVDKHAGVFFINSHLSENNFKDFCYNGFIPTNKVIELLLSDCFNVCFSISGSFLEQAQKDERVLESFQSLIDSGHVDLISRPFSEVIWNDKGELKNELKEHASIVRECFGVRPSKVFANPKLYYSDSFESFLKGAGFKAVLTEGDRAVLTWRSPNYIYHSPSKKLKLFLRNGELSDKIALNYKQLNLTPESFSNELCRAEGEVIVLNMDYSTFGYYNGLNLYNFLQKIPYQGISFVKLSELLDLKSVGIFSSGNVSVSSVSFREDLLKLKRKVRSCNNGAVISTWKNLLSLDNSLDGFDAFVDNVLLNKQFLNSDIFLSTEHPSINDMFSSGNTVLVDNQEMVFPAENLVFEDLARAVRLMFEDARPSNDDYSSSNSFLFGEPYHLYSLSNAFLSF